MLIFCHLFISLDFIVSVSQLNDIDLSVASQRFGKTSNLTALVTLAYKTRDLQFLLICHIFLLFLFCCSLIDIAPVTLKLWKIIFSEMASPNHQKAHHLPKSPKPIRQQII